MSQNIRSLIEQKLESVKEPSSQPAQQSQEQKIIVIHNGTLSDKELNEINGNLFTLMFNFSYHSSSPIDELLKRFQCVIIDVSNKDNRLYYAQNQANVSKVPNVKVVFQSRRGKSIEFDDLKAEWKANYIVKYLPKVYNDASDFLAKLLNDHVGSFEGGLKAKLKAFFLKKISCICD